MGLRAHLHFLFVVTRFMSVKIELGRGSGKFNDLRTLTHYELKRLSVRICSPKPRLEPCSESRIFPSTPSASACGDIRVNEPAHATPHPNPGLRPKEVCALERSRQEWIEDRIEVAMLLEYELSCVATRIGLCRQLYVGPADVIELA